MAHLPESLTLRPFSIAEAESLGISRHRLRQRALDAPYRGIRVRAEAPNEDETDLAAVARHCRAYSPRLRADELFWGPTAAALWDCPLPHRQHDRKIHLAVRAPLNATREAHVVGHQTTLRAGRVETRGGLPVSDPATTWLALAPALRLHDLVAVGDHLAHIPPPDHPVAGRPFLTLDELASRVRRFRGRGKNRASEALELISTRAESRPETLLRLLLHDAQLPVPEVNPIVLDAREKEIGRADLVFRSQRVIVEYDGDQHRTDSTQYEKDMTRLERFHRADWTVIRVRKHGLFTQPWSTVRHVARALSGVA